jgi:outer membrane lipoprotein-sorting protein
LHEVDRVEIVDLERSVPPRLGHAFRRSVLGLALGFVLSAGSEQSGMENRTPATDSEPTTVSSSAAQSPFPRNGHLSARDLATVNAISAYFNAMTTLKGAFDQQNQDGSLVKGDFYLKRPGRMRFEYADPQPLTLLSDGAWVMLNDRELESVDRYPLRETPLYLILKRTVDLAKDAYIVKVEREGDLIGVTTREEEGAAQGDLTLVFASISGSENPGLELRHWMVEDVQGNRTLVSLRGLQAGMELDHALFVPEEYDFGSDDPDF